MDDVEEWRGTTGHVKRPPRSVVGVGGEGERWRVGWRRWRKKDRRRVFLENYVYVRVVKSKVAKRRSEREENWSRERDRLATSSGAQNAEDGK